MQQLKNKQNTLNSNNSFWENKQKGPQQFIDGKYKADYVKRETGDFNLLMKSTSII